jgi:hypothetical protein
VGICNTLFAQVVDPRFEIGNEEGGKWYNKKFPLSQFALFTNAPEKANVRHEFTRARVMEW